MKSFHKKSTFRAAAIEAFIVIIKICHGMLKRNGNKRTR